MQEAARKDVERAFGVLQARWEIVRSAAMIWESKTLWRLMTCCVIMCNMIVEDEGDDAAASLEFENMGDPIDFLTRIWPHLKSLFKCINKFGIEQLKKDLIKHL